MIVAASAGRALPFEWLPALQLAAQNGRPAANFGVITWTVGDAEATVDQNDSGVTAHRVIGAEGRALTVTSNDEGPRVLWGDDVLTAIDRGLVVVAFSPAGQLIGQWAFALDETPGVQLPPTPFVLRGESPCQVLRPGEPHRCRRRPGRWPMRGRRSRATGKAVITIDTDAPPSSWRLGRVERPRRGLDRRRNDRN